MSTVLLESQTTRQTSKCLTYCRGCGCLTFTKALACQRCGAETLEKVSRQGEIYSYTVVQQDPAPFVLALVRLSKGPLVTAQIVGAGARMKIGMPVRFQSHAAEFEDRNSGRLYFTPAADSISHKHAVA